MANVFDTPGRAMARIRELGLPRAILEIWEGKLHRNLAIHWRRPSTYFSLCHELVENVTGLEGLCPLWEENGDTIVGILPDGRYVSFLYENAGDFDPDPNECIDELGRNYQQFVTTKLDGFADSGLDDTLELAASVLEYRYLAELRRLLDAFNEETWDEDFKRFREMLD